MTMNIRKIALTGAVALGAIVGVNAPAFSMTASEFYAYVKDCHGRGGTTGIHEDGTLGCHIGMAGVDLPGFKEALVPSKAQIKKLSIKRIPAGVSRSGTVPKLIYGKPPEKAKGAITFVAPETVAIEQPD